MRYRTINPATGELVEEFANHTDLESEAALERAARRFPEWRGRPLEERASILARAADLLEARAGEYAALMALEMGKPLAQGEAEARKCALACRWYVENGGRLLSASPRATDASRSEVRLEPLGPILAIMPWNFPFWQFFRFAAPALLAGNVALLKHAPSTPRCAQAIERLILEAGFPEGAVQNLYLANEQAARLVADERLRGVTFTGSTRGGRQVAAAAGRGLKPTVMELGGSDPFVVFDDAGLDDAVATAVAARCQNSGQSCIAAKRFLVQEPVLEAFLEGLVAGMKAQKVGDPTDPQTRIGPLAREDLRDRLAGQVEASAGAGARILCGGKSPAGPGWFYPPTVLAAVPEEAPAFDEELFGPVATVLPFATEEEAVALANATPYGLGASVWTGDGARAERMAAAIEAGAVFINGMVKSDPALPFGGVKDSGFGRELSDEGILEFVNKKTVWIR